MKKEDFINIQLLEDKSNSIFFPKIWMNIYTDMKKTPLVDNCINIISQNKQKSKI